MFNLKKENTKVSIDMHIDQKEWEAGVQKVYETSKGKFNCPGFRKGQAPKKVIEKQYGETVFFEDTVEYFVNKTIGDVLNENPELEPVAMPQTSFKSFTEEDGLKMEITFEVVPTFTLGAYKGVTIKVHSDEVTDADLEEVTKKLLDDNSKYEAVDRAAKIGDHAVIDFEGFIDDKAFEGGKGADYALELGSKTFIDTFEDQIIGKSKGDKVDVNVTFPENYGAAEFAGKKALFKVEVKEVREKTVPTLDDKFIADTTEFETLEEYKKDAKANISKTKAKAQDEEFQYNMREELIKSTKLDLPETMIEAQVNEDLERMKEQMAMYGITLQDYLAQMGSSLSEYMENAKVRTANLIKTRYIYRKLIEENNLSLTPAEIKQASAGAKDENDVIKNENELILNKLHTFLKENNKIEIIK